MILKAFGWCCVLFRRLCDKAIGIYQLSRIEHGIGCEIRGGAVAFREI